MDTNYEDKMYHQIEKNLSNNMNENLFSSARTFENTKAEEQSFTASDASTENGWNLNQDIKSPKLTRAEYIRQAREACLKAMSSQNSSGKALENIAHGDPQEIPGLPKKKRTGMDLLFGAEDEEASLQEVASYRSLIIRTVCAVVLFLTVFLIDKFKVNWGDFSYELVREYVTGKDHLKELESLIVSWLK